MKENEFYEQQTAARQHRRSAQEAFNKDISKALIELITNSCDAYKGITDSSKKPVFITYDPKKREIILIDNAKGVSWTKKGSEKCFMEIMEKGSQTSGREAGVAARGFHGIGLKDVCISMEEIPRICAIKDDKISIIRYGYNQEKKNYGFWPIKKDESVKPSDRKCFRIPENGFYIDFKVPEFWENLPHVGQLKNKLETHRELRKILENPAFEIYLNEEKLTYESLTGKVEDSGNFIITWKNIPFKINYLIKLADQELTQEGSFWKDRIGGLLVYHSGDAVLDLTLFKFDGDPYASKLFGEIEIIAPKIEDMNVLLEEGVVDEKRRGLDLRKEFNIKLKTVIESKIKPIVDREKQRDSSINRSMTSDEESKTILRDINNIIKSELGKADTESNKNFSWRPVDRAFGFFPSNKEFQVREFEPRGLFIVINKEYMKDNEIVLGADNPHIKITPKKIKIKSNSFDEEGFSIKRIKIYSEKIHSKTTLKASNENHEENLDLVIIENPNLNPGKGFSFIPEKIKIPPKQLTDVELYLDTREMKLGGKLELSVDHNELKLTENEVLVTEEKLKKLGDHIRIIKVKILGEKVKISGKLHARYKDRTAECLIEVLDPKELNRKNFLEGINLNEKPDPASISKYDENEKIIYIFCKHPIILAHRENRDENIKITLARNQDMIFFISDLINREISEFISKEKIKKVSGEINIGSYEDFKSEFNKTYRDRGPKLLSYAWDLVINYIKKKIESPLP